MNFFTQDIFASDCNTIQSKDENIISTKLLYCYLTNIQEVIYKLQRGQAQPHVYANDLENIKIPIPPKNIQEKIVKEIEAFENLGQKAKERVEHLHQEITKLFTNVADKAKTNTKIRLSDNNIFDISIGQRVLKSELLPKGDVPVYSANVFEPFGYVNKYLIKDFSKPSVLWGIDGDWMVNYMPNNISFYPTDHCGVLRVKNNEVNERYLAYVLQKEGEALDFSRNKRASIDRIQGIKISLPSISIQEKLVSEIEKTETEITALKNQLENISEEKNAVLKKYL